ncbi:MAG: hypothetical protein ACI88H_003407 [Cocleimonas sp.]|jgi:hypothetical protein
MKNRNQNNTQDRKFKNQVSHLSGFIGMPMWNGRNPSLAEIREYDRRILEKQALNLEARRTPFVKVLFPGVMTLASKAFSKTAKIKKRTKVMKHDIAKARNTPTECCE